MRGLNPVWSSILLAVFIILHCEAIPTGKGKEKINEAKLLKERLHDRRSRRAAVDGGPPSVRTFFYDNPLDSNQKDITSDELIDRRKYAGLPIPPQRIRLRGETHKMGHSEGRIEVYDEESAMWGIVCDSYWTVDDASVACRQLGFPKGAALIYREDHFGQGSWDRADILYTSLHCEGDEKRLQECPQDVFQLCTGKSAGVTCFINEGCPKGWLTYNGMCYRVMKHTASFLDSVKYCETEDAKLAYIIHEDGNNFLSNMLMTQFPNLTNVWIGGYYKESSTPGQPSDGKWQWYQTYFSAELNNLWFPGFTDMPNTKSPRRPSQEASCMMLRRAFPDPVQSNAYANVDYFWWDNESCRTKAHAICQKLPPNRANDCYNGNGATYRGSIARTLHGSICASWANPKALINNVNTPRKGLGEHNFCRNPDNDRQPWCWIDPEQNLFGYCNIARCDQIPDNSTSSTQHETKPGFNNELCHNNTFHCPSLLGVKPYKPCVKREQVCDGTIHCPSKEDEDPEICKTLLCKENEFYCLSSHYCISKSQLCDGHMDCQHGEDEDNCTSTHEVSLKFYQAVENRRLVNENQTYHSLTLAECAVKCTTSMRRNFNCLAFNYKELDMQISPPDSVCELTDQTHQMIRNPNLKTGPGFSYYFRTNTCQNEFRCWNGQCVSRAARCNGVDDCGDLSDEKRCPTNTGVFPPLTVRLSDGRGNWEGRVEVQYEGEWGAVCDDGFDIEDANVICKQLGFATGLSAVHNSWDRFGRWNGNILLSGLRCTGRENSIEFCRHNGWQEHKCSGDEAAGVECMVSRACTSDEFLCHDGKGCISNTKFCDGQSDCLDNSDENGDCSLKVRLKGSNRTSGLVYVSRGPMRGTVCEDEFDDLDAQVICRMLNFTGKARAVKDGRYGRSTGVVMLDNLRCHGNESSLMDCPDFTWASHNCDNTEDVAVECDVEETTTTVSLTTVSPVTKAAPSIVCGERQIEQLPPRFAGGFDALQGAFPWQVGIRKKRPGRDDTSHHCGGTIISEYWIVSASHCFAQPKSLFKVRVGDWNNQETSEQYEAEFEIDELYLHPQWAGTKTFDYDLALIKVRPVNGRGIQFSEEVQPACLPSDDTLIPEETQKCFVSGWGFTKREYPDVLKAAVLPLIPQAECNAMYKGAITDRMVCAGFKTGGLDACSGDSGGPLVCLVENAEKYVLWGATSFGRGCGEPNRPGVYAKVKVMLDWVLKTAVN